MLGDGVGMEAENLCDEAMLGTFVMHADDKQLGLVLLGRGRVVEGFRNVVNVLVGEFEVNHFGHP